MTAGKEKNVIFIRLAVIIILGLLIYFNSLTGQFVWDDAALIKDNAYIKDWSKIINVFTENIGSGAAAGRKRQ